MRVTPFRLALLAGLLICLLAPGSAAAAPCPSSGQYASAVLGNSGLVGYWRLDDASGTTACDGLGTNPGTYSGGVSFNANGALGGDTDKASTFNGTSGSVSVPSATALNTGDTFTIEAWTKRGTLGTSQTIATKQGTAWTLGFNTTNSLVLQQSGTTLVASSTTVADTTTWHHVVATKSGTTTKLYIDGVDRTGKVTNKTFANTTSPLLIASGGTTGFYNGTLDEVALYKTALPAADVTNHYLLAQAACPVNSSTYGSAVLGTTGLVGYWRFGESSGTTACDSKGRNPGTYGGTFTLGQSGALGSTDPNTALLLNGTNASVSVPAIPALDTADTFSFEAWLKRGSTGTAQVIASKQGTAWTLAFSTSNNLVLQQNGVNIVASSTTVTDTTSWHHVAATKTGTTTKLYIDGVDRTGTVTNKTLANTTSPLVFGQSGASASFFKGTLDEAALYNVALPAATIQNHYGITQPPSNTSLPTVTGTATAGQTLTATSGTWSGSPTSYAYQWQSCSPTGTNCADVAGATQQTYALGAGDLGTTLRVVVTASNAAGSRSATSATSAVVQGVPPSNTATPSVTGTTVSGQTLTADPGTWDGTTPLSYTYQWESCAASGSGCAYVTGATGPTYALAGGDIGTTLRVQVTATNAAGSASATSAASAVVQSNSPSNTSPPTLSGPATVGSTLTAANGTWGGSPSSFAYQWQSCDTYGTSCVSIGGATGATYTATSGDYGTTLRVIVTGSSATGSSSARSAPTATVKVGPAGPANTGVPSVAGTASEGETLRAAHGSWTGSPPPTFAYQWQACDAQGANCTAIAGAVDSTYTLGSGDVGTTIRVAVTATNSSGPAYATSDVTGVVTTATGGSGGSGSSGAGSAPPGAFRFVYDGAGRLSAVTDPTSQTALYGWDAVGNLLSINRRNSSDLTIIQLSPSAGPVGSRVSIQGTGFGSTIAANAVDFNGTHANIVSATPTEIVARVPSGATSGPVTVTAGGQTTASAESFTVDSRRPAISGIAPTVVAPGGALTINGRNFDSGGAGNLLHVNQSVAEATSGNSTSIQTTVPAGTGSGPVSVATQYGDATGPDVFVPPSQYTADDVTSTGRMSIGGTTRVSTDRPDSIGMVVFDATPGQRVSMQTSRSSYGTPPSLSIRGPDGQIVVNPTGNAFVDAATLPVGGTYALVVDPSGRETGATDVTLFDAGDATGTITPGGAPVTIATTVPGQAAALRFTGSAGQRVSVRESGFSVDHGFSVKRPDGTALWSNTLSGNNSSTYTDTLTLPSAGTYTIVFDPQNALVGATTVSVYDVGADIGGTLVPSTAGSSATVATSVPGQNGVFTFNGVTGQKVSALTASSTYPNSPRLSIVKPDGTNLVGPTSNNFVDAQALPADGTYKLVVDPQGDDRGSIDVTLYDASDVTGSLTAGGAPLEVTTRAPGQLAAVTFSGTAGQRVALRETGFDVDHAVGIKKPDGTWLWNSSYGASNSSVFSDVQTLPSTGTYTIVFDPSGTQKGSDTLTLYDVGNDVTGTLTPSAGGSSAQLTTTIPGQGARYTFSGIAGQKVSLTTAASTFTSVPRLSILKPDGSTLSGPSSTAFVDAQTLPSTGTYTVVVDPQGDDKGSLRLTLFDASDVTASITPGGAAVALATTVPGQAGVVTFSGTAGQRVSLRETGFSADHSLGIKRPDGSWLWSSSFSGSNASVFSDVQTLPATGTYTIVFDPSGTQTGPTKITLFDVPGDAAGTLSPTATPTPTTISTTVAGQNARYSFTGVAGRKVSLTAGGGSYPSTPRLSIVKPDGSTLTGPSSTTFLDAQTLPVAGTYTVVVDPQGNDTGSLTLSLYDATDTTATMTPGGPSATVTTGVPGQAAVVSFSGTSGQRIALRESRFAADHALTIKKPDGSTLWGSSFSGSNASVFTEALTLTATGTYTIVFDPSGTQWGGTTLELYDVPADITGTLVPSASGASANVVTNVPSQNARYTFSGSAGQKISVAASGTTYGTLPRLSIVKPDGTNLYSPSQTTQIPTQTLPSSGTYTLLVDPQGADTGAQTVTLFDGAAVAPTSGGTSTPVTSSTAGQVVTVPISGTAGQKISVTTSNSTYPSQPSLTIKKPDGTTLVNGGSTNFIDAQTLPTTGTYSLVVTPQSTQTGSLTATVWDASDLTASVTPGGAAATIATVAPGQNGAVAFAGTAGQRVSLRESGFNIDHYLSIKRPDGTTLWSSSFIGASYGTQFSDVLTLPTTGTYTIVFDPQSTPNGPTTLTLYDVPADPSATLTPSTSGAAVTVATPVPGQNGRYSFSASAGQKVAVTSSDSSYPNQPRLLILRPDGSQLTSSTVFLDATTLTAAGTYTLVVDPQSTETGSIKVTLYDASDTTTTLTPTAAGASTRVTTAAPGKNATVTFDGTAGQRISLRDTGFDTDHYMSIRRPDGATLWSSSFIGASYGNQFSDVQTLPSTGTYTVVFDPYWTATGSTTITLHDVPSDAGTTLTPSSAGARASASISTPGQNARYPFSGAAGQKVSVNTSGNTFPNQPRLLILRPDGSQLTSSSSFLDATALPAAGTYTLVVDPQGNDTGSIDVALYDASDLTASTAPSATGMPVDLTTVAPGQNGAVTFAGTAGQRISLRDTGFDIDHYLSIKRPDGGTLWSSSYIGTGYGNQFADVQTLPATGTYTVVFDVYAAGVGSTTLTLYDVGSDAGGTLTPSAAGSTGTAAVAVPGQNARFTFSASAGQKVAATTAATTFANQPRLSIVRPDGSTTGQSTSFLDQQTLTSAGTYTLLVDPQGIDTGSLRVTLYDASDVSASVTPSAAGTSTRLTAAAPGQNGAVTFSGTAGQRISVRDSGFDVDHYFGIKRPDGSWLWSSSFVGASYGSRFSEAQTLPTTGTYTVVFDPYAAATGSTTLTVFDVGADVSGTLTPTPGGSSVTLTTIAAGQNGRYTFSGTTGQKVSVATSGNTYANQPQLSLLRPDGVSMVNTSGSVDGTTLPSTGTYTLVVDPQGNDTGSIKATLYDASDVTASATPSAAGTSTRIATQAPGQNGIVTFSGVAGQRIALKDTAFGVDHYYGIKKPDGSWLWSSGYVGASNGTQFLDPQTLPVTGTYSVVFDPYSAAVGATTFTLYDVPADISGTLALSNAGAGATVSTTPGQVARYTFDASAGQTVSLAATSNSYPSQPELSIIRPDGSAVISAWATSFVDRTTLPVSGTYKLIVDPQRAESGSANVMLYDTADATGTLSVGGAPVRLATTAPGQVARFTFTGTAGATVRLALTDVLADQSLTIYRPDGTYQTSAYGYANGGGSVTTTLSSSGTYSIVADPNGGELTSMTLTLSNVPTGTPKRAVTASPRPHTGPHVRRTGPAHHSGGRRRHGRRHHRSTSRWRKLPPLKARPGATAIAGQTLNYDGTPVAGVTLAIEGSKASARSDRSGRFLLVTRKAGHRVLHIDGASASSRRARYGTFDAGIDIARGRTNVLPYTTWLPRTDSRTKTRLDYPLRKQVTLTTPRIPNLEVRIPAGSVVRDGDSRRLKSLTVTPIPVRKPPFPLPRKVEIPVYFTIQPGGAYLSKGAQLIYPNPSHIPARSRVNFWTYDAEKRGWFVYGRGTVAADGRQIVPDAGVRVWELSGAMIGATVIPPGKVHGLAAAAPIMPLGLTSVLGDVVREFASSVGASSGTAAGGGQPERRIAKIAGYPRRSTDSPVWTPDRAARRGNWRTQRAPSPWEKLPGRDAPRGHTAISGQALTLDGLPLAGVTFSIEGTHISGRTDSSGRFLLDHLAAGHRVLVIDGRSANSGDVRYGQFEYGIDLERGKTNDLGFPVWMTRLDRAGDRRVDSPTTDEVVLKNHKIPGLEVRLPKGSLIHDADGNVVRDLNLTQVPIDRAPFPLPKFVEVPTYFTVQPGRAYLSKGAQIVYPNFGHLPPGQRVDFWNYDAVKKGWYVYGKGTVTPDGKQVMPDAGVRVWEFTGAMISSSGGPPGGGPGGGPSGGDPVDLASGLFVYGRTDLALPDTMPISLTRTYRPGDGNSYSFGVGTTSLYDMRLWSVTNYTACDLIMPDGSTVHYVRTSPGSGYTDAVYEAQTTPGPFFKSTIRWSSWPGGGWDLRLRDGTTYIFGEMAPLQAIRDRFGNQVTLTRSNGQSGNITQLTTPHGRWIKMTYDSNNRITSARDNAGRTVSYTYDASGRIETATDPRNGTTTYGYDAGGNMKSVKDPRNNTYIQTQYDANGRVQQQTTADNATYTFDYVLDANGKVTKTTVTGPRGRKDAHSYNSMGMETAVTQDVGGPNQRTTTWTRDATTGRAQSVTDPRGRETRFGYDTIGNLTSITLLAGTAQAATTSFTWDPTWNRLTSVTNPLNKSTTYEYDAKGQLQTVRDATGRGVAYGYAGNDGLPTSIATAAGLTTMTYDHGSISSMTDPTGATTRYFTDSIGRVVSMRDPSGRTSSAEWNANNQPTKEIDPAGHVTSYAYDPNGNITSMVDAKNHEITATYDAMNRVKTQTDGLTRAAAFDYDKDGNVTQTTDRKGKVTAYAYDSLDRLYFSGFGMTGTTAAPAYESTLTYHYDNVDRLGSVDDSAGPTIVNAWDDRDHLQSQTTGSRTVSYGYDGAGRRASMTAPGQTPVTYGYDDGNRLTSISSAAGSVGIGYDTAGRRSTVSLPGGVLATYGYDGGSRVTDLTYTAAGATIGDLHYSYTTDGLRSGEWGSLAHITLPAPLGSATYDADNSQTAHDGVPVTHDANGNVTADGPSTYTWNTRGQMTSMSTGTRSAAFAYDAFGRRTSATVDGQTTGYVHDGQQVVQEQLAGGGLANMLTGGMLNEVFARTTAAGTSSYLRDALGTTMALTDGLGGVQTSYSYDPFGGASASGAVSDNTYQFTGQQNDGLGVQFFHARYYNPASGQFLSPDPLGVAGSGSNMFAYAAGSPTNFVDPTGLLFGIHVSLPSPTEMAEHFVGAMDGATFGLTNTIRDNVSFLNDDNIECTTAYQESYGISRATSTVVVSAAAGYGGAGLAAEALGGGAIVSTAGGAVAGGGTQSAITAAYGQPPSLGGVAMNIALAGVGGGAGGFVLGRAGINGLVPFTEPLNSTGVPSVLMDLAYNNSLSYVTHNSPFNNTDTSAPKSKCGS